MAESRSWSACAGPRRGSGLWRLWCTPSSWDGQNGSLTGRDSRGVSLPQQPPILHASSDSVVEASPTSSFMELSGSGAGADMWWMQARCAGRRPSRPRCAGRLRSAKELACAKGVKQATFFRPGADNMVRHGTSYRANSGTVRRRRMGVHGGSHRGEQRPAIRLAKQTDSQPDNTRHVACGRIGPSGHARARAR